MESMYLTPWYSPSGSFLKILPIHKISECQDKLKLDVIYTSDTIVQAPVMFVQLIRRGIPMKPVKVDKLHIQKLNPNSDMLKNIIVDEQAMPGDSFAKNTSMKIPALSYIAHSSIELEIKEQLTPISRIIVFFVRNNREVVADSTYFFAECLKNKVKLSLQKDKQVGAKLSFDLEADQNSLCNVHVLDKASKTGSSTLTKGKLFDILQYQDIGRYNYPFQNGQCKKPAEKTASLSFQCFIQHPYQLVPTFSSLELDIWNVVSATSLSVHEILSLLRM
ncbi:ovostatin-like [Tachypleus tridentatus]|uniref:ovostatin-like n=1 Tax=Tachypleus tridentatus TaxID=6853 RepID=UPI003FD0D735